MRWSTLLTPRLWHGLFLFVFRFGPIQRRFGLKWPKRALKYVFKKKLQTQVATMSPPHQPPFFFIFSPFHLLLSLSLLRFFVLNRFFPLVIMFLFSRILLLSFNTFFLIIKFQHFISFGNDKETLKKSKQVSVLD